MTLPEYDIVAIENCVFLGPEVAIFGQEGGTGENFSFGLDWESKDMPQ